MVFVKWFSEQPTANRIYEARSVGKIYKKKKKGKRKNIKSWQFYKFFLYPLEDENPKDCFYSELVKHLKITKTT